MVIQLLLFLSKTDRDIYNKCPKSAKNTQLSFGLFVLLTGLLAFFSGSYAIMNMFIDFDWRTNTTYISPFGKLLSFILGLFYAIMIVAIDREVVASKSKLAAIPRLFLAIVIGIIVAVPIELKLLEGKIEKKLIENYKSENMPEATKKENALNVLNKKKNRLENHIDHYQKEIDRWSEIMEQETSGKVRQGRTGKAGQGPAYREANRNMLLSIENKKQAQSRYDNFINNEYVVSVSSINKNYENQLIAQRFDLLSKFQALHQVIDEDKTGSAGWMSRGLTLLFVLFEIIPSLIKLMTTTTEYDVQLEARRRMNIQVAHSFANKALNDFQDEDYVEDIIEDKKLIPLPYMKEIQKRMMR